MTFVGTIYLGHQAVPFWRGDARPGWSSKAFVEDRWATIRAEIPTWWRIVRLAYAPTEWWVTGLVIFLGAWSTLGTFFLDLPTFPHLDFGIVIWAAILLLTILVPGFVVLAQRVITLERLHPGDPSPGTQRSWLPTFISALLALLFIGGGGIYNSLSAPNPITMLGAWVGDASWQAAPIWARYDTHLNGEAITPSNVAFYIRIYNSSAYDDAVIACSAIMFYNGSVINLRAIPAKQLYWTFDGRSLNSELDSTLNLSRMDAVTIPAHHAADGIVSFTYSDQVEVMHKPLWVDLRLTTEAGRKLSIRWNLVSSDEKNDKYGPNSAMLRPDIPAHPVVGKPPPLVWLKNGYF